MDYESSREAERAMYAEHGITMIGDDDNHFQITGSRGDIYNIRYAGSGDADPDYVSLWECDCPAGRHGRSCKHLTAFLAARNKITDF